MRNARMDEAQAGIKTVKGNINNLRYADDTTIMAESKEELKSLLMKVKEENEKAVLKLNIPKTKIMASDPITSWQMMGKQWQTSFWGGSKIMQSTSWEMLGWKKHKLESILLGEISITSDMQIIPPLWQKVKRN